MHWLKPSEAPVESVAGVQVWSPLQLAFVAHVLRHTATVPTLAHETLHRPAAMSALVVLGAHPQSACVVQSRVQTSR